MTSTIDHFNALFNSTEAGIAILGYNGNFIKVNHEFERILGYSNEELQHLSFMDLTHPEDMQKTMAHMDMIYNNQVDEYFYKKRYMKKDKTYIWAEVHNKRFNFYNTLDSHLLLIIKDYTETNNLNLQLSGLIEHNETINLNQIMEMSIKKDRQYFRMAFTDYLCATMHIVKINSKIIRSTSSNVCINNISGGGLQFITNFKFPTSKDILLEFNFTLLNEYFCICGHILRSETVEGKYYKYAIKFDIDETRRVHLVKTLNKLALLKRNHKPIYKTHVCSTKDKTDCPIVVNPFSS